MKPPYRNALGFHYPNKACVRLQCRNGLGGPALNRPSCCSTARLQHGRRVPAELQSGALTMRVQPRIMQLRRFMTLLVQRRVRCPKGESQTTRGRPRIMQSRRFMTLLVQRRVRCPKGNCKRPGFNLGSCSPGVS